MHFGTTRASALPSNPGNDSFGPDLPDGASRPPHVATSDSDALPDDVNIPDSLAPLLADGRHGPVLKRKLRKMPVCGIKHVLTEYDGAVSAGVHIRNPRKYLFGIIHRYLMSERRSEADKVRNKDTNGGPGSGGSGGPGSSGPHGAHRHDGGGHGQGDGLGGRADLSDGGPPPPPRDRSPADGHGRRPASGGAVAPGVAVAVGRGQSIVAPSTGSSLRRDGNCRGNNQRHGQLKNDCGGDEDGGRRQDFERRRRHSDSEHGSHGGPGSFGPHGAHRHHHGGDGRGSGYGNGDRNSGNNDNPAWYQQMSRQQSQSQGGGGGQEEVGSWYQILQQSAAAGSGARGGGGYHGTGHDGDGHGQGDGLDGRADPSYGGPPPPFSPRSRNPNGHGRRPAGGSGTGANRSGGRGGGIGNDLDERDNSSRRRDGNANGRGLGRVDNNKCHVQLCSDSENGSHGRFKRVRFEHAEPFTSRGGGNEPQFHPYGLVDPNMLLLSGLPGNIQSMHQSALQAPTLQVAGWPPQFDPGLSGNMQMVCQPGMQTETPQFSVGLSHCAPRQLQQQALQAPLGHTAPVLPYASLPTTNVAQQNPRAPTDGSAYARAPQTLAPSTFPQALLGQIPFMTLPELVAEKSNVKHELIEFEETFRLAHGRAPTKDEKPKASHDYYKAIKARIHELE